MILDSNDPPDTCFGSSTRERDWAIVEEMYTSSHGMYWLPGSVEVGSGWGINPAFG